MTDKEKVQFIIDNYSKLSGSELSSILNWGKSKIRNIAYKNKIAPSRGRSKFSYRPIRKNDLNDFAFKELNPESCYWAGLIAADGCVINNVITLGFKSSDLHLLEEFKNFLDFKGDIKHYTKNYIYKGVSSPKYFSSIHLTSPQIVSDLKVNFNISSKKSLTLTPPNIYDKNLIDCFICGLLDGDGSICLLNSKRQKTLCISLVGTWEIISWVNKRINEIVGTGNRTPYFRDSKINFCTISITDRQARKLFLHLYPIKIPRLKRKWTKEFYEHCSGYKKFRNMDKYKIIYKLLKDGLSIKEISNIFNCSVQAILWYTKREEFLNLENDNSFI
jgi:hypothetical protein